MLSINKFPPSHVVHTSPRILLQVRGASGGRPVTSPATAVVKPCFSGPGCVGPLLNSWLFQFTTLDSNPTVVNYFHLLSPFWMCRKTGSSEKRGWDDWDVFFTKHQQKSLVLKKNCPPQFGNMFRPALGRLLCNLHPGGMVQCPAPWVHSPVTTAKFVGTIMTGMSWK